MEPFVFCCLELKAGVILLATLDEDISSVESDILADHGFKGSDFLSVDLDGTIVDEFPGFSLGRGKLETDEGIRDIDFIFGIYDDKTIREL